MSHSVLENSKTHPWAALEHFVQIVDTKLHKLADKAVQSADESHLQIHLGLMELEDTWQKLHTKIERQVNVLHRLETKAATAKDEAKLHAHLAKEDIISASEKTRNRLRHVERRLHNLKVTSESEASDALKHLSNICSKLARRLEKGPVRELSEKRRAPTH